MEACRTGARRVQSDIACTPGPSFVGGIDPPGFGIAVLRAASGQDFDSALQADGALQTDVTPVQLLLS
jgi:hypothetical protein